MQFGKNVQILYTEVWKHLKKTLIAKHIMTNNTTSWSWQNTDTVEKSKLLIQNIDNVKNRDFVCSLLGAFQ